MQKRLKIAIDYDGTIAKTMEFVCELINLQTGRNYNYKDVKSWDFWEKEGWEKQFWNSYNFLDKNGRLSIKPYDDHVFKSLDKLVEGRLDIVTANNEIAANDIASWVDYYGNYDHDYRWLDFKVNCIGRKTAAEKLSLDYDLYIDDNPNLAIEAANHPNKRVLLANAPWNKEIPNSFNVRRFESWEEIPKLIESIKSYDGK